MCVFSCSIFVDMEKNISMTDFIIMSCCKTVEPPARFRKLAQSLENEGFRSRIFFHLAAKKTTVPHIPRFVPLVHCIPLTSFIRVYSTVPHSNETNHSSSRVQSTLFFITRNRTHYYGIYKYPTIT